jgi:hypothetical protein
VTRVKIGMLACLLLLAGCDFLGFKEWRWRQRLTIEVETPNGVVSGGSVVEVIAGSTPKWIPGEGAGGMGAKLKGEASFVEVAPGRYLFALLSEDMEDLAFDVFFERKGKDPEKIASELENLRGTREVPPEHYPLLITFDDISDPKTLKRVDPANLAASFGSGASLKRITLEITDEGVENGTIENILPWWSDLKVRIGGDVDRQYGILYGIGKWNFKKNDPTN